MKIFPAIDLYEKKAVRLLRGDYENMTVYSTNPIEIALDFQKKGARYIHMVDLEGAKSDTVSTPNLSVVEQVAKNTDLFVEIGGGIRNMETVKKYFNCGVSRVILGTAAAVTDESFLRDAVASYGDRIAVGADIKDGYIAIKGWLQKSEYTLDAFLEKLSEVGVSTVICTDVSRDGAMKGTNLSLYSHIASKYSIELIASGGVSSMDDVKALSEMGIGGAIIGKAYYTGVIDLEKAIKEYGNDN